MSHSRNNYTRGSFYNEAEYDKAYRDAVQLAFPEELRARCKRYRDTHPNRSNLIWQRANPDRIKHYNLRKFGITIDQYIELNKAQLGLCAICKKPENENKSLAVDHCHTTGKVRGLLCAKCNQGLGSFKDDTERLTNAIKYLTKAQL